MAAPLSHWPEEGPSLAARAFANFDPDWSSPDAMLDNTHAFAVPATPATPDNNPMIFALDMEPQPQPPQPFPRTGTLDGTLDGTWDEHAMAAAYTHIEGLGFDDSEIDPAQGNFYLSDPNSFSGSPSSWDVGTAAFNIDPPLTPDSPAYSGDSLGISPGTMAPFSPQTPLASSFPNEHPFVVGQPRTRSSGRVSIRRTHTHTNSFSSPLRGAPIHAPQPRPTMHMRAMSHSGSMLSRPTNLSMSPRTLRNSTLDAALAQTETPLHFHHVIATPFSSSAPSRPAPIASKARSSTPEESVEEEDDKRKSPERSSDLAPPTRSRLHPPKQAPSTWQIFFTEYLQNYKSTNPERKLNVSQAAKDGGAAYKALSSEQKEIYKRKARIAKEEYERELAAWQRMLTPDDIRTENAFRSAQRKAGKSRRSNLKDPNAPKKPLSAYFMFLQWIRADPARVHEVFGDETETTRQSVLAAAKWRTLSDAEKKPFLAQAEREKLEYEAARKEYEERTTGISNPAAYGGYMRMNGGSVSSTSSWHHTEAEPEPMGTAGRRRSSSSRSKLAGGAAFGALMFTPGPVFDEDGDGDMDEYNTISWKA